VNLRVIVEAVDRFEQLLGWCVGIDLNVDPVDPDLLAVLLFHRNIGLAGRIVAHEDSRQAGGDAAVLQCLNTVGEFGADVAGDGVAVDDLGHYADEGWGSAKGFGTGQPASLPRWLCVSELVLSLLVLIVWAASDRRFVAVG